MDMRLNDILQADLRRYTSELSVQRIWTGLSIPGFRYTYLLRKSAHFKRHSLPGVIYRFLLRIYSFRYGYQINPSTQIGKGLYIGHRGTIIINSKAILGMNCNLSPGVTIGQTNRGSKKGAPVLGNQVWIGTNAVIVGGVSIGDNVLIAPNTYVNQDIPSNSIVIGNPAQIIYKENATEGYIEFIN